MKKKTVRLVLDEQEVRALIYWHCVAAQLYEDTDRKLWRRHVAREEQLSAKIEAAG